MAPAMSDPRPAGDAESGPPGAAERVRAILERIPESGLFAGGRERPRPGEKVTWRVSPEPVRLDLDLASSIEALGRPLRDFIRAANRLYLLSRRGRAPSWVAGYLDQGVGEHLADYARQNRFRQEIPRVIRPDVVVGREGIVVTELDSVPGGMGLLGCLSEAYAALGDSILGGSDGMVRGFRSILSAAAGRPDPVAAVVISDEASDYRPEMEWLAGRCTGEGASVAVVDPHELAFAEEGFFLPPRAGGARVDVIYRFFELFDLKNVAKAELMMYAAKKRLVAVTPPFKHHLEEKALFALFCHPRLESWWRKELGEGTFEILRSVFPKTWILDPRPLPPHAVIPGLGSGGIPVQDWGELAGWSQKERACVIKVSGFSELAWGSRGVVLGEDLSQDAWADALRTALANFAAQPSILQEYRRGRRMEAAYMDSAAGDVRSFHGRARLCPYYFLGASDEPVLGGVLATVCPGDKKILHGMRDAVMAPCRAGDRSPLDALGGQRV